MIRINLLSLRRSAGSRKAADSRKFLIVTGIALLVVLAGGLGAGYLMDQQISDLSGQRRAAEKDLATLKAKAGEIANFESDRDAFEQKIAIIRQLRANQSLPVKLLDQVAMQLPERAWLLRMNAKGGELTIVGRAMGNSDIVEMMQRMKSVEVITNLQLIESRRISEKEMSAYEFTLTGQLLEEAAS